MFDLGSKRIGITIDQTGVRYVTIKKKKSWEIGKYGHLPIPEGMIEEDQIINAESLSLQLKAWVKQEKLKGATATLSIPTSQIIIRKMRIPSIKAHELRQLVELEVETALRLPFEDPVYDFIKISHDDESTQVLVFAAPKKLILSYVKVLEDAGLHVRAAEISATSLARSIAAFQEEHFAETMLISLDHSIIEVYMFQNGNPIFMRTITLFDQGATQDNELTGDQIGEIIAELSRMLSFYQYSIQEGNSRIANILVTGTGEGRNQLAKELQLTLTELDVKSVDFSVFSKEDSAALNANDFRVATGLSMLNKQTQRINLLPTVKTETKIKFIVLGGLLIIWVAGIGITSYTYMNNRSEISLNTQRLTQLNQAKTVAEGKLTKNPTKQASDPGTFIQAMRASQKDVVQIINDLKKPLPVDAQLNTLAYSADSQISLTVIFLRIE
ncbi:pilus assembly protein PilM [Paenibacillus hexagrammi]|uniref:Pilus assembly protein PilM n=1 Tax=Paenibacillus hexagrammi TaxID=2908839 RepID=A0ABY3SPQ3_9BACL|nr:pilus assembly protein PilM [Paenibacillus sp. YPD9-1]UJF35973.1 pilus assembly protein PilM [Paenibacillus sp. YPD9-1]